MQGIKSNIIPAGSTFLPGTGIGRLREMHSREADPKARERLLAYVMRKDGASIRAIGTALNRSYSTVRDWLVRASGTGISGRYDAARPGAPCKLDGKQLGQLRDELVAGPRECGFESGVWTAPLVVQHVENRFGVTYNAGSMRDLLHRIGFSCKKPRPRHPKSASEPRKKELEKKHGGRPGTAPRGDTRSWLPTSHRT